MSRKLFAIMGVLLACTALQAAITVKQGEKVVTYKNGSVIHVEGSADTTVTYNGVEVFVPQGTSLRLAPGTNDSFIVTGQDLAGVKILGLTINAPGNTVFVVDKASRTMSVRNGALYVTNQSGQKATVNTGYRVLAPVTQEEAKDSRKTNTPAKSAKTSSAAAEPGTSITVLEDFVSVDFADVNTQQATQNVEEEALSPSAPR